MDKLKELEEKYGRQKTLVDFLDATFIKYVDAMNNELYDSIYFQNKIDKYHLTDKKITKRINVLRFMQIILYGVAIYRGLTDLPLLLTLPAAVLVTGISNTMFDSVNEKDINYVKTFNLDYYQKRVDDYQKKSVSDFLDKCELETELSNAKRKLESLEEEIESWKELNKEEFEPMKAYYIDSAKVKKMTYNRNKN